MENRSMQTFLRACGCVLVVLLHSTALWKTSASPFFTLKTVVFFYCITVFVVPLFFFLSSWGLYEKYNEWPIREIWPSIFHKLKGVVIGYVLWSFLYLTMVPLLTRTPFQSRFWFKRILQGDSSFHMYFMIVLIQFYLLFPLLLWLYRKLKKAFFPLMFFVHIVFMEHLPAGFRPKVFLSYLAFFCLGLVIRPLWPYLQKTWVRVILLFSFGILFAIKFISEYTEYNVELLTVNYLPTNWGYVLLSLSSILVWLLWAQAVAQAQRPASGLSAYLAKRSGEIYYLHPLVLLGIRLQTWPFATGSVQVYGFLMTFCLTFLGTLILLEGYHWLDRKVKKVVFHTASAGGQQDERTRWLQKGR